MGPRPPLPIFENREDARRYLMAVWSVVGGMVLLIAGVLLSLPIAGALPYLVVMAGFALALAGQALYLALNARVWARHYPNDPWDWRTARGFYEDTLRATLVRARAMARRT
ncbi:MAG: hypothetical protein HYX32_14880 [Actinobacteria bacterium]|nr:hypothetical protein [Actinomycetota bacterium]